MNHVVPDPILNELDGLINADELEAFDLAWQLHSTAFVNHFNVRDEHQARLEQLTAQLWPEAGPRDTLRQAQRSRALLRRHLRDYVAAWDDQTDLPLTYPSTIRPGDAGPIARDFDPPIRFLTDHFPSARLDPWTDLLRAEGLVWLHSLAGDWYREQVRLVLNPLITRLHEMAETRPAGDRDGMCAAVALIMMLGELGFLEEAEVTFDTFRAKHQGPGRDPLFPWAPPERPRPAIAKLGLVQSFGAALGYVAQVKRLHNRPDDPEPSFYDTIQARLLGKRPPVGLPPASVIPQDLAASTDRQAAASALDRVIAALARPGGRGEAILRLWQAYLRRANLDIAGAAASLKGVEPDDGGLGILAHALRGEVAYHRADYEDAWAALADAGRLATVALDRYQGLVTKPYSPDEEADRLVAARRFRRQLALQEGHALFFLADYGPAHDAYARAAGLAGDDPLDRVVDRINLGNLALLANNLVDRRGYATTEPKKLARLAQAGPETLREFKLNLNATSLRQAEDHYRAALDALSTLPPDAPNVRHLTALVHINLAHVGWSWAQLCEEMTTDTWQTLVASLPTHSLASGCTEPADCYRRAVAQQTAALDTLTGPGRPPTADGGPQQSAVILSEAKDRLSATCLVGLSELYFLLGEYSQGLAAGSQARELLHVAGDDPELRWRLLFNLARLHDRLSQEGDCCATLAMTQEAEALYRQAVEAVEGLRAMVRLDDWQATSLQEKLEVYEGAIDWLVRHGGDANAPAIFKLFEQVKARAFLDLLDAARLDLDDRIPPDLRAKREALRASMAAGNEELRQAVLAGDQARFEDLKARLDALDKDWQVLRSRIAVAVGDLATEPVGLADFQAFLRDTVPDAAVLSFVVGRSKSYLLVIDAHQAHVFCLPGRRQIELAVGQHLWQCQVDDPASLPAFCQTSQALVYDLLRPALPRLRLNEFPDGRPLVIIPDGVLFYLPFETLLVDLYPHPCPPPQAGEGAGGGRDATEADWQALVPHCLIGQAVVSYVQSASTWIELCTRQRQTPTAAILGVYNINYEAGDPGRLPPWAADLPIRYQDLIDTEAVGELLDQFGAKYGDTGVRYLRAWVGSFLDEIPEQPGLQSTEDNFTAVVNSTGIRYVLFAGHGVYNDKYPHLSGLIFNLTDLTPRNTRHAPRITHQDGFLGLPDVFALRMEATELTFLAACQTGLGAVFRGEGVNALIRAFMHHGSQSVVASLWSVNSDATTRLTDHFFELLLANPGMDKARALQQAKLKTMPGERGLYALPFYWAPFVLVGAR
jgi:hypothetical protein